jgi:hypothetical protein
MPVKKLPASPLPPRSPNYANARGKSADEDTQGIYEEANPGIIPGSMPPSHEGSAEAARKVGGEHKDKNYAQYMNRGDGRYLEQNQDSGVGSFGPDEDQGGRTKRIHRLKSK